jgi:osmoprotectant transport system substrate-binding protein
MRRRLLAAVLLTIALLLAGCGDPLKGGGSGGTDGRIIIGASSVGETQLIAEIYAGALRQTGADVEVQPPAGSREVVVQALQDKSLTLVPDYSGNLLQYFDEKSAVTAPKAVYAELPKKLPAGIEVLEQAPAQDTDQMVVTRRAAAGGLRTVSDLGPRCKDFTFGGPGEWPQRWKKKIKDQGPVRLRVQEHRHHRRRRPGHHRGVAQRPGPGRRPVQHHSRIKTNGFVPLRDDKNMFPAQNIVPLAAKGTLTRRQKDVLNRVSAALTTERLTKMDDQYLVQKLDPLDIAEQFFREAHLTRIIGR